VSKNGCNSCCERALVESINSAALYASYQVAKSCHRVHLQYSLHCVNRCKFKRKKKLCEMRLLPVRNMCRCMYSEAVPCVSSPMLLDLRMRKMRKSPTTMDATTVVRPGPQSFVHAKLGRRDSTPSFAAILTNRASGAWTNAKLRPR
jgi:hypothetical protein